jgi:hypothetical protein
VRLSGAELVAKDDDPHRLERLARIRWVLEQLKFGTALVFVDELDLYLMYLLRCFASRAISR